MTMDGFRNWLMHIIAGKKFAYWIADDAADQFDGMGTAGSGAAIVLARTVEKTGATSAQYTLNSAVVSVKIITPQPDAPNE